MNKKGFTLIELMVIIVIIGILAAIALPSMFNMSAKGKFMNGNYSEAQRKICLDYFNANSKSSSNFSERINERGYSCKDYLKSQGDVEESPVTEQQPSEYAEKPKLEGTIYELFISGNITDDERSKCTAHMLNAMRDNDLSNAFESRVRNGLTCETMMNAKRNNNAATIRYKIVNDETVIFYSKDADQLAADMAEVKDKMTKKNIKSSIQTETGAVVSYSF